MPFPMMIAMSCLWNTRFLAFYDKDVFCGMMYIANIDRQTFIVFFAVPDELRSNGYGSRILAAVRHLHPKNRIIVSIEPCQPDRRRLWAENQTPWLYIRNGYRKTGYYMRCSGIEQEVLSFWRGIQQA